MASRTIDTRHDDVPDTAGTPMGRAPYTPASPAASTVPAPADQRISAPVPNEVMSGMTTPYQYMRLDEAKGEIRVLTLLPGAFSDKVRVTLDSVSFPGNQSVTLDFEALSYTWGSPVDPIEIFIGSTGLATLSVTQNLAVALPYLRDEHEARVLWIDAICVNQQDVAERSSQVKRMADIYSKATRCIIWTGQESNDSDIAMDTFEEISTHVTFDYIFQVLRPKTDDLSWCDLDEAPPFSESLLIAILNLLSRSWFERLWIWQETYLSSRSTILLCGRRVLLWTSVCDAVNYLYLKAREHFPVHDLLDRRLDVVGKLFNMRVRHGLIQLIARTKKSKCADPRDRIFAVLSMLPPWEIDIGIVPDYARSVSDVYYDAAVRHIVHSEELAILSSVESRERISGLPGWVPDFSVAQSTHFLDAVSNASSKTLATCTEVNGSILSVTGVQIAVVRTAEIFRLSSSETASPREIAEEIRRIFFIVERPMSSTALAHTISENFCSTIVAGDFPERWDPPASTELTLKSAEEVLQTFLHNTHTDDPTGSETFTNESHKLLQNARHYCPGRSIFTTESGNLGLGPRSMKAGDIVAVIMGFNSALVLRPAQDDKYMVVGEAYCHGYMDGEALLGSFPSQYQPIYRYDEQYGSYWWSCRDSNTGNFVCEDPRLGDLPAGWTRKSHSKEEFWTLFRNEETGEELGGGRDPRLAVEELRSSGIPLRIFDLV